MRTSNGSSARSGESAWIMSWFWAKRTCAGCWPRMPTIIMHSGLTDLWPKTPRSSARSSVSALSHQDRSLAAFTTNIAESDFRYTQRYFLLAPKRNDRSPLRPVRDDNRNSHRAETEYGLRRKGHTPRGRRWGPRPRAPEALAPVLQPSQCLAALQSASLIEQFGLDLSVASPPSLNRR